MNGTRNAKNMQIWKEFYWQWGLSPLLVIEINSDGSSSCSWNISVGGIYYSDITWLLRWWLVNSLRKRANNPERASMSRLFHVEGLESYACGLRLVVFWFCLVLFGLVATSMALILSCIKRVSEMWASLAVRRQPEGVQNRQPDGLYVFEHET